MKRSLTILFLSVSLLLSPLSPFAQEKPSCPISVYFSPHGGCTEAIVKELGQARTSVMVMACRLTSMEIARGLLNAHKCGVKVQVILDKGQKRKKGKYSDADFFYNQRIPVKIDPAHAIMHNKAMVIDGETAITGSFNFTRDAEEKNTENLLVIRNRRLAELYTQNWKEHADHSEPYAGRAR